MSFAFTVVGELTTHKRQFIVPCCQIKVHGVWALGFPARTLSEKKDSFQANSYSGAKPSSLPPAITRMHGW